MKAQAPSNIAFIKYWGKKDSTCDEDRNIGDNPSLSMTLSKACTTTEVNFIEADQDQIEIAGKAAGPSDQKKVSHHLDRLFEAFDIPRKSCQVLSSNNFPTAAGIASSASAYAALTLAGAGLILGRQEAQKMLQTHPETLSRLARRGSGSASRSFEGPFVYWEGESATKLKQLEWPLFDSIVIFSSEAKEISSSQGHELAKSSPLYKKRQNEDIKPRTQKLKDALESKDIHRFGELLEEEAKQMHAVMESSTPPVRYISPQTRDFLAKLEGLPDRDFYWTLDAGSNPHIISQRPVRDELQQLLDGLGLRAEIWEDQGGSGALLL